MAIHAAVYSLVFPIIQRGPLELEGEHGEGSDSPSILAAHSGLSDLARFLPLELMSGAAVLAARFPASVSVRMTPVTVEALSTRHAPTRSFSAKSSVSGDPFSSLAVARSTTCRIARP
mmetsp:Transcript_26174/g.44641  ORF Transcript_26174/g.44641 Transcript_26174/m.44641 type:complete len:118 (-) Transcript_26174:615-968(-)